MNASSLVSRLIQSTLVAPRLERFSRTLAKVAPSVTGQQRTVGLAMARVSDVRRRLDRVRQTFKLMPLTWRQLSANAAACALAFLLLGSFRLVSAAPPARVKPADEAAQKFSEESTAKAKRSLTVTVGDEQGRPLDDAEFNAWYSNEKIKPEKTGDGEYKVEFPADARFLRLEVKSPHRVPHNATWREGELQTELDDTFEFRIPEGTTISGRVLDAAGKPIEGATVSVLDATGVKDRVRPQGRVYDYPVKTDADGRWVCDVMPKEFAEVWLKLTHPDYISDSMFGDTAGQVSVDQLRDGTHGMVMKQGITVKGKILDTDGNPIEGATIFQGSDRFGSDFPQTKSNAAGEFEFAQSKLGRMILTIVAKKFAPDLKAIEVTAEMGSISIELKPGKTIRLRTVDSDGNPLSGVWVVADTWRGHRSLADAGIPKKSNEDGVFVWKNAPDDEVAFDMLATGFLDKRQHKVAASDKEQIVKFIRPLKVVGKVIDAKTKLPLGEFEVIQGIKFDQRDQILWERESGKLGSAGAFESSFDFPRPGHLLRIEAKGYAPAVSRVMQSDEGNVSLDFELEPSAPLEGIVTTDDGKPAVGTQVVIALPGQYVQISNGRLADVEDQLMATTNEQGRFELPSQSDAFKLLFLHSSGASMIAGEDFTSGQSVELQPWSTISGQVRIGSEPAAETAVVLHHIDSTPYDQPRFQIQGRALTDTDGRFVLNRVLPGESYSVQRVISVKPQGERFTHNVRVTTEPGRKHEISIGGDGRPVIGRVVIPNTDAKYDWGTNVVMTDSSKFKFPDALDNMTPEEKQSWYEEWGKSEEGIAYTKMQNRMYAVMVSDDGRFRVDDVPAGDFTLSLSINAATPSGQCGFGESLGNVTHRFTIPAMPDGRSDEPMDIGNLTLKLRRFINVGDTAPSFQAKTLSDDSIELSDFAGKYVLLDFWATWCGPCLAEMPNLKKVQEQHKDDDRLVIISLNMDADIATASKYIQQNPMAWTQAHIGDSGDVQSDYGIQSIPATFLIGPDGKVIAKDLRGDDLINAIDETLGSQTINASVEND